MDRLRFDRESLDLIFSKLDLSLEELSQMTGAKPRAIKNWRTGSCTMPISFFHKLCDIDSKIRPFLERGQGLDSNWGRALGGRNVVRGLTKREIKDRMQKARDKKAAKFPAVKNIDIKDPIALEFYGAMMGDGCVSRYYSKFDKRGKIEARITGNLKKDFEYVNGVLLPITKKLFNVSITPIKRRSSNVVDLVTCASHVSEWLVKNNFPIGKKLDLQIPPHLMLLPPEKLNNLIRGLFDTDGCVAARKDEEYKYPYVFISAKSRKLREQLKEILRKQGIPAYMHADTVVVRGCNNFKIWFKKIGSSNPRNIKKYEEWLATSKIKPTGL